jgi:hypothetical protein
MRGTDLLIRRVTGVVFRCVYSQGWVVLPAVSALFLLDVSYQLLHGLLEGEDEMSGTGDAVHKSSGPAVHSSHTGYVILFVHMLSCARELCAATTLIHNPFIVVAVLGCCLLSAHICS